MTAASLKAPKEMSHAMLEALVRIGKAGGSIERRAGGYWVFPGAVWAGNDFSPSSIATTTIRALVARNKLRYSEYTAGRKGSFPIKAEVTHP